MSLAENFAFLLPLLQLMFGVAFLIVGRWGSPSANIWGAAHLLLAAAYIAPTIAAPLGIKASTLVSDALFLAAFACLGQALLLRLGHRRHLTVQGSAAVIAFAAVAYAVVVQSSLRAEIAIVDLACASLMAAPLLLRERLKRRPIDRVVIGLTWLAAVDILARTAAFVLFDLDASGFEGYAMSSYAYFQQVSASVIGPAFALSALAAVTIDMLGTYRDAAEYDPMTGLLNRRGFERAAESLATVPSGCGAVVTCDIDHFKRVNDTFGHAVGDRVIVALAELLKSRLPAGGFAARFGGEEFVLFLPDRGEEGAGAFAETLRLAFARRGWSDVGIGHEITASFGVARRQLDDRSLHDAIARADQRLYAAKAAGRNQVMGAARRAVPAAPLRIVSAA